MSTSAIRLAQVPESSVGLPGREMVREAEIHNEPGPVTDVQNAEEAAQTLPSAETDTVLEVG